MAQVTVTDSAERYVRLWARAGYAARGIVYLLIGGLAVLAVVGAGGGSTDSRGALQKLLQAPFGDVLLVLIAAGLVGFAVWRSIQTVKDPDHHGRDARGLVIRAGLGVSAVLHLLLAFFALSLVVAFGGSSGSGGGTRGFAGWLMEQPYGRVLVMIVGATVIGAGIAHAIKGWKAKFDKYLQMPSGTREWAYPVCRLGLIVRGIVLIIIGGLFFAAGYYYDPSTAGGLQEMFDTLRRQVYGAVLFAVVAVGLFAFGVYGVLEAVYRRVEV